MANTDLKAIVAVYPDLERAREGVNALEAAGIEAANIHLEGGEAEAAAREGDTGERDARVVKSVSSRAVRFAAIGAVLGAVVGLLLGLTVFDGFGLIGSALAGAASIGGLAAFVGGMSKLSMSEDWELTHETQEGGRPHLRLETTSDDELLAGIQVLRGTDPVRVIDLTKRERHTRRGPI